MTLIEALPYLLKGEKIKNEDMKNDYIVVKETAVGKLFVNSTDEHRYFNPDDFDKEWNVIL